MAVASQVRSLLLLGPFLCGLLRCCFLRRHGTPPPFSLRNFIHRPVSYSRDCAASKIFLLFFCLFRLGAPSFYPDTFRPSRLCQQKIERVLETSGSSFRVPS